VLLAAGCAKRARETSLLGVEADWNRAKTLYERERYSSAQKILREVTLNYSGSAIVDSAYFLLGMTSFELGDYLVAADEFERLVSRFPSSTLAGDANFYKAKSNFELSPSYSLDQDFTVKAFDDFQRFLEDYPDHALADSAYYFIDVCRNKMALKIFRAGELYFTLGQYASSALYADVVLANYYDTPFAERAQFLKARSYYELKDWSRAKTELESYLQKFPDGASAFRVRQLLETSSEKLAGPLSAGP
jgi:outer membrane protein assembly factor BamD